MLTSGQIKSALEDRNLREVSRRSGVSYGTLINLAAGRTRPSYLTRRVLTDYLLHGIGADGTVADVVTEPR